MYFLVSRVALFTRAFASYEPRGANPFSVPRLMWLARDADASSEIIAHSPRRWRRASAIRMYFPGLTFLVDGGSVSQRIISTSVCPSVFIGLFRYYKFARIESNSQVARRGAVCFSWLLWGWGAQPLTAKRFPRCSGARSATGPRGFYGFGFTVFRTRNCP